MPREPDTPDRDFTADEIDNLDIDTLRSLLERSDAAELFDAPTRESIGRVIARAVATPRQSSVPQQQQQQQRTEPDESDEKD